MKNNQLKILVCIIFLMNGVSAHALDTSTAAKPDKLQTFNTAPKSINQPNSANLQELPPDTIQTIQMIGRSVLAAKHSETIDPNTVQMKSRMQALRQSLDEVIKVNLEFAPSDLSLSNTNNSGNTENNKNTSNSNMSNKRQSDNEAKQLQRQQRVGKSTYELKQRLNELKAENHQSRKSLAEHDESEHQLHLLHLLDKSQAITDEVDAALVDNSPERIVRLMKLKDRLAIKTLGDMQATKTAAKETPTISTITHHRE